MTATVAQVVPTAINTKSTSGFAITIVVSFAVRIAVKVSSLYFVNPFRSINLVGHFAAITGEELIEFELIIIVDQFANLILDLMIANYLLPNSVAKLIAKATKAKTALAAVVGKGQRYLSYRLVLKAASKESFRLLNQ